MNTPLVSNDDGAHAPSVRGRRILVGIWMSEAFALGGFIALLLVNRLLDQHLDLYAAGGYVDDASAVLDLMDNLLAYLVPFGAASLLLGLVTVTVSIWFATQAR